MAISDFSRIFEEEGVKIIKKLIKRQKEAERTYGFDSSFLIGYPNRPTDFYNNPITHASMLIEGPLKLRCKIERSLISSTK